MTTMDALCISHGFLESQNLRNENGTYWNGFKAEVPLTQQWPAVNGKLKNLGVVPSIECR